MVYEDEAAWPRAFFVDKIDSYGKVEDFVRLIKAGDGQPFAAIQKGTRGVEATPGGQRHIVAAQNYRLTANQTHFTIQAPGPGVVVLTEAYMPGDFIVKINGSRAEYFRVNHAFRGVKIPQAGAYEISYSYWPAHFHRIPAHVWTWFCASGRVAHRGISPSKHLRSSALTFPRPPACLP